MKKKVYFKNISIVIISTSYFSIYLDKNYELIIKYWWKNVVIQIYKYKNKFFAFVTSGHGITNSAMAITYIIEKFKNIKYIINYDYLQENFESNGRNICGYSNEFSYKNSDFTPFNNMKKCQIFNEPISFKFESTIIDKINDFKFSKLFFPVKTGEINNANNHFNNHFNDLESGALAQIIYKTKIKFISFKIFNNYFPFEKNNIINYYEYCKIDSEFKFCLYKILLFFLNEILWEISSIGNDILDFFIELYKYSGLKWLKNFIKNPKKVISVLENEIVIYNKKNNASKNIIFSILKNNDDFNKQYYYSYFYNNSLSALSYQKNINVNYDSLLFNYKKMNNCIEKYSYQLYLEIEKQVNLIKEVNKDIVIKFEINSFFKAYQKDYNNILDDIKISNNIFISKILKNLNSALFKNVNTQTKVSIYFYITNNNELLISHVENKKVKGKIQFNTFNKWIDKNFDIIYF